MWRRLRGRSMAPRRPVLFPEQWPLAIATAIFLLGGIAVVIVALTH